MTCSKISKMLLGMAVFALGALGGCDQPPGDGGDVGQAEQQEQAVTKLPACSASCDVDRPCSTGCSITDSNGPVAMTCNEFMHGSCGGNNELDPNAGHPGGGGSGSSNGPFCDQRLGCVYQPQVSNVRQLVGQDRVSVRERSPSNPRNIITVTKIRSYWARPIVSKLGGLSCVPVSCDVCAQITTSDASNGLRGGTPWGVRSGSTCVKL